MDRRGDLAGELTLEHKWIEDRALLALCPKNGVVGSPHKPDLHTQTAAEGFDAAFEQGVRIEHACEGPQVGSLGRSRRRLWRNHGQPVDRRELRRDFAGEADRQRLRHVAHGLEFQDRD